ncbi:MAG: YodL domain-containing protein, partial [Ethanoligenens sp.]
MFRCEELQNFAEQQKLEVQWADGVFDWLSAGDVNIDSNVTMLKACRIFQLKPTVSPEMKFISYDEMVKNFGEPSSGNYDAVYDGQVESNNLEAIYEKFDLRHPEGFIGHNLSMSDIVELYDQTGSTFYYCDRIGFRQIDFTPP